MGICQIPVSGKRGAVVSLYASDGSALSGNYGVRLSGAEFGTSDGYADGSDSAGDVFHFAGIHTAKEFFRHTRGND